MSTASSRAAFMVKTESPEETMRVGEELGALVQSADVVCMTGSLGSGKTLFVKGLAKGMGVGNPREVTSPSFTLVNRYDARVPLYHVDAFRLAGPAALEALGSDELFYGDGVVALEWAERVEASLPGERLDVHFEVLGASERGIRFMGIGKRAEGLVRDLRRRVERKVKRSA